ncbi:MAG: hypothetical protein ACYC96_13790 [Fimbriimonadaceae bacterium]
MKVVWIICSGLCVCGLICSGILFGMGRSLLVQTRVAAADADTYALSTVKAVCRRWDADELARQLDHLAKPGLAAAVLNAGKPLGPLQSAEPFFATAIDVTPENGRKSTRVTVSDNATFEHGAARLRLVVVNGGDAWKLRDFQILPTSEPRRLK